jgi:serine/threonine-protein kinase
MAGAAVALAAVFPLVAAGLAPAGAAAGAAAGTAAGTAAATGTAAGVTAGGGVSAAVAAKAAGAVIAATAVAAGGAGVYAASTGGDAAPADRPRAVQVRPVSFTRTSSGPTTRVTARVPHVSGLPAGLAGRVNALIREPAERWAATAASDLAAFAPRDDPANPYTGKVEYDVGLNGPRLFSVRYTFSGTAMTRNTPAIRVVTVDLTTGRALAARDFLRPDALTQARMSALTRLLGEYGPGHGALCDEGPFWDADGRRYTGKPSDAQDLTPALVNEGVLHMLPTRQGIDFYPPVARMGYSMACGREWRAFHIPYRRLGSFVRPDVFRAAGAAVPTP